MLLLIQKHIVNVRYTGIGELCRHGRSIYDVHVLVEDRKLQNYGYTLVRSEVNACKHTHSLQRKLWPSSFSQMLRQRALSKSAYHLKYFTTEYFLTILSMASSKSLILNSQMGLRGPCIAPSWQRLMSPDAGTEYRHLPASSPCHCSFHYISWSLLQE